MAEEYGFAVLREPDILACMEEMGIGMSMEHLKRPTMAVMTGVYEKFVALLMGEPRFEQLPEFQNLAEEIFDYPELYEIAIGRGELRKRLFKLMAACGVENFSLADVIKPTPRRTKENLSALINFAKLRVSQLPVFESYKEENDYQVAEAEAMMEEEEMAREELARLLEERDVEAPKRAALLADIERMEDAVRGENEKRVAALETMKAKKVELQACVDAVTDLEFHLTSERQDVVRLRAQIVSSPDKLEARIAQLAREEEDAKAGLAETKAKTEAYAAKRATVESLTAAFSSILTLLDAAEADHAKAAGVVQQITELEDAAARAEAEFADLAQTEEYTELNLQSTEEKQARLEVQNAAKKAAAEDALAAARTEHAACENEFQSAKVQMDENSAIIQQLKDKMDRTLKSHENEIASMEASYDDLRARVKDYHTQLFECIATGVVPRRPALSTADLAAPPDSGLLPAPATTPKTTLASRPPATSTTTPLSSSFKARSSRASIGSFSSSRHRASLSGSTSSLRASLLGSTAKPKRRTSFVAELR